MHLNNIKRKSYHSYQIVFDGKDWFAWYDCDLSGLANKDFQEIAGEEK